MKNQKSKYAYRNRVLLLPVLAMIALDVVVSLYYLIYDLTDLFLCSSLVFFLALILISNLTRRVRYKIAEKYVMSALYQDLDPDMYKENLDVRNVLCLPEYAMAEAELDRGNYQITLNVTERLLRKKRAFPARYSFFVRKLHIYHCLNDIDNLKNTYKELDRLLQSRSKRIQKTWRTPTVQYFEAYANGDYEACISICKNELATWEVKGAPNKLSSVLFMYRLAVALFMAKDYVAAEKYFSEVQEMAPKLDIAKRSALYLEAISESKDTVPSVILTADPEYRLYSKKARVIYAIVSTLFIIICALAAPLISRL